jgi:hypothetical protein
VSLRATYFVQECPICGRRLQVRLEFLGKAIACPHCQGQMIGEDPASKGRSCSDSAELLLKADQLLAHANQRRYRPVGESLRDS